MKKLFIYVSTVLVLMSCDSNSNGEHTTDGQSTEHTATENHVVLDDTKTYPFMELKALYQKNWIGEEEGNPAIDNTIVTVTGEVFEVVKMFNYVDGESQIKGVKVLFRGSQFSDPDFGHDFECIFPLEKLDEITVLEEGQTVIIAGTIEKQEVYIDTETYTVLSLQDSQLTK